MPWTSSSHRPKWNIRSLPTLSMVKDSLGETRPRRSVRRKSSFGEKRVFVEPSLFLIGDSHVLGEKLSGVVQTIVMMGGPLLFLLDIVESVLSDPKN